MGEESLEKLERQEIAGIEKLEKKLEGEFGFLERVTFLDSVLDKQSEIRNMLDVRSNIIIGFNSALIVFMAANFSRELSKNPFLLGALGVVILSLFAAIVALRPPHLDTKKGQKESIFYHNNIDKETQKEYRDKLFETLSAQTNIYDAYALEIYNITHFSNVPRKYYLYLSIKILIYGLASIMVIYALFTGINILTGVQSSFF